MNIILRSTLRADLQPITLIERKVYSGRPWSHDSFAKLLQQDHYQFLTAELDQQVVGYLVCQIAGDEAELHNIAIEPTVQKKGIASQLLALLLRQLTEQEVASLFLLVRRSNQAAIQLYRKFHFQEWGCRHNYYHDPSEDALVFRITNW